MIWLTNGEKRKVRKAIAARVKFLGIEMTCLELGGRYTQAKNFQLHG